MEIYLQVLHIEKRVSIAAGLNRHITRQQVVTTTNAEKVVTIWVPDNADSDKTAGNVELIPREIENPDGSKKELTLQEAVDKRIREAGIKPRVGQVTCLEIIFSGSQERMLAMNRDELKNWAEDTVAWAKKTWGEENIVSASLHVDETTPHIHMVVVPIVTGQSRRTAYQQNKMMKGGKKVRTYNINHNKLRLCVNEVYTNTNLYVYHESYANEVSSKYGMVRGVKAEPGSKKKHDSSIDYNRELARQAAENQKILADLKSDYESLDTEIKDLREGKTAIAKEVKEEETKLAAAKDKTKKAEDQLKQTEKEYATLSEQKVLLNNEKLALETDKETLTKKIEDANVRLATAESGAEKAKTKAAEAEKIVADLEEKIDKNTKIINSQVEDYNSMKEELSKMKTDIEANKETLAQQTQTISDNEATIQKQERLKSSTVISDDAADRKVLEKLQILKDLESEETNLNRSIIAKKTELAIEEANVKSLRAQLQKKVNLDDVPQKKGLLDTYKTEDVDKFIVSVGLASLRKAMNEVPVDVKVDAAILEENTRLRAVEDDYRNFMNSPERMLQQIERLENMAKRHKTEETLKYVLRKDIDVLRFETEKTEQGDDIFVKFTIKGQSTQYAAHISPDERISYTDKPLDSLRGVKEHRNDKIWRVLGSLTEIRRKREREDTMSRYSNKLSLLTNETIKVIDYVAEENHFLLFASNGRAYDVGPDGSTWSTGDSRVKTLADIRRLSNEKIWTKHGNINEPKIYKGIKP